ncbi:hypothetical protein DFP72DRAFT_1070872 [Ephemerocybe angulata]|uniref:Uncharacterized protein n=1 Tax=Ephemerocybe angulata TaxID=980116 RepID=A0A8H6HSY3_9AGAR|nr:hypothetical protein DFP72DRAFT_1070872 [Tulosesus angulatus]
MSTIGLSSEVLVVAVVVHIALEAPLRSCPRSRPFRRHRVGPFIDRRLPAAHPTHTYTSRAVSLLYALLSLSLSSHHHLRPPSLGSSLALCSNASSSSLASSRPLGSVEVFVLVEVGEDSTTSSSARQSPSLMSSLQDDRDCGDGHGELVGQAEPIVVVGVEREGGDDWDRAGELVKYYVFAIFSRTGIGDAHAIVIAGVCLRRWRVASSSSSSSVVGRGVPKMIIAKVWVGLGLRA